MLTIYKLLKVEIWYNIVDYIQIGDILLFKLFGQPKHVGFAGRLGGIGSSGDINNGDISLIHCHSHFHSVTEHIVDDVWLRMLMAVYRFDLSCKW